MMPRKYIYLPISIFILNVFLRFPALFQELPPNTFCDEDLIINNAFYWFQEDRIYLNGIGQINYSLAIAPSFLYETFTGEKLSKKNFIILARIIGPIFLNSLGALIMFFTGYLLFNSILKSSIIALLYTFSPMILGLSRIFYPDHFIIVCSTVCLMLCVRILKGIGKIKINLIFAGMVVAIASSIKLNGAILIIPCFCAIFCNILEKTNYGENKFSGYKVSVIRLFYLIVFFVIFFIIFNPALFIEGVDKFETYFETKKAHYSKSTPYLESNNSYLFYFFITYIVSYGWVAFFLLCIGINNLFKNNKNLLMLMLVFPISLIIILGQFKVVTTRNTILALPFMLPIVLYGLETIFEKIKLYPIKYIFVILIFFEPFYKSLNSCINDFKMDSREKAKEWISNNIPEGSTIASNRGCFQPPPFGIENYNFINLNFSSELKHLENYEDIDYLVLDSWFGDMIDINKHKTEQLWTIIFTEPIFNNLYYLNPGGVFYKKKYKEHIERMKNFNHFFSIYGYGPDIFIYKNIN